MKKILLMLTGGTICSFLGDDGFKDSHTEKAAPMLIENFKRSDSKYLEAEFEVISPLNILSENMRIEDWNIIIEELKNLNFALYKGIIITHGTDTLGFTASFLSAVLGEAKIPIVFVSSQFPLDDERTNGNENFKNAVEIIEKGVSPNVYALYRNDGGVSYIHKGKDLEQCRNYSNDFFSKSMTCVKNWNIIEKEKGKSMLKDIKKLKNQVLVIQPYLGMDYSLYNLKGKRVVLHGTYHSSTACVSNGEGNVLEFIKRCHDEGVIFLLSSVMPELIEEEAMYSSTGQILKAGAIPMIGETLEYSYGKAVAGCSVFERKEDLEKFLKNAE